MNLRTYLMIKQASHPLDGYTITPGHSDYQVYKNKSPEEAAKSLAVYKEVDSVPSWSEMCGGLMGDEYERQCRHVFAPKGVVPITDKSITFGKKPKVIPGPGPTPLGLDYSGK